MTVPVICARVEVVEWGVKKIAGANTALTKRIHMPTYYAKGLR